MTTTTTPISDERTRTTNNRIGLWLFLLSDAFVFAGLYISRYYLLGVGQRPEVNQWLGLGVTTILLTSSFFMNRAEMAASFGDKKSFLRYTLVTILLGTLFLVGVVGVEWQMAPFGPDHSAGWSIYFTMTGFHAFHVLTGVLFLAIIYRNGRKGVYNPEHHWPVEAAAVYWHFIDLVWVFYYPALYLIGIGVR